MSYAIETNGLSKFFGQVRAVDSLNLRVEQGEIYGFLGLNGAGKCIIRAMPISDSGACRSLIPFHADQ